LKLHKFGEHFRISNVAVVHVSYFAILLQGSCKKHNDFQIVHCCIREQTAAIN